MLEISARLTLPKDALGNNYLCLISLLCFHLCATFFSPHGFSNGTIVFLAVVFTLP